MASLKDMRVRLASTKATQKITKAMQMVAASKLRRAQVAAEAARPFAERMDRVRAFESGLLTLLRTKHADLLDSIRKSGDLSDADAAKLKSVVDGYAKTFT
jgi:ATP synthase F1 gamma subunit